VSDSFDETLDVDERNSECFSRTWETFLSAVNSSCYSGQPLRIGCKDGQSKNAASCDRHEEVATTLLVIPLEICPN